MLPAAITSATLGNWLAGDSPLVILDARARLSDPEAGAVLWRQGHIPGALHADMNRDLSAAPTTTGGRHPLPEKSVFAERLRAWGITPRHTVVVYDDTGNRIAAARAWWMLTWAGHPAVHVLDGGWQAWQAGQQPVDSDTPPVVPSDWQPDFDDSMIATAGDVARGDAAVLDARAGERYRGDTEPIDPAAGHIPGARNVPGASLLTADNAFLPAATLRQALPDSGNAIAYCGSGISACQVILAYATLGKPLPRLYPGSWSAWSRDPERPVATGPE